MKRYHANNFQKNPRHWSELSSSLANVLFGMAILIPDDRERLARLSVRLDPPSDDLQIGAVRRRANFDESSVDADDHLLRRLIGFSIFGDRSTSLGW
jgi:hypothetical protein